MSEDGVGIGTGSNPPAQTDHQETEAELAIGQNTKPTEAGAAPGYPFGPAAQPQQGGGLPGLAGFAQLQGLGQALQPPAPPESPTIAPKAAEPEPEVAFVAPELPRAQPEQPQPLMDLPPRLPEAAAPEMPEMDASWPFSDEAEVSPPALPSLETATPPALPGTEPVAPPLPDGSFEADATFEVDAAYEVEGTYKEKAYEEEAYEVEGAYEADSSYEIDAAYAAMDDQPPVAADEDAPVEETAASEPEAAELAAHSELPEPVGADIPMDEMSSLTEDAASPEDAMASSAAPDAGADSYGQLQAFEAHYDQNPEVPIGAFEDGTGVDPATHAYFQEHGQEDADFLENEMSPENMPIGIGGKGRRLALVSGSLVGALVLGGALAVGYKQTSNAGASGDQPPLIRADSRPVKMTPTQPGGKQFPHKNKLIYDRLLGEESPEVDRVVPRQEEVTASTGQADGRTRVALAPGAPAADTGGAGSTGLQTDAASGGPRKVKTLVVRPDGTIVQPASETVDLGPAAAALKTPTATPAVAVAPVTPSPAADAQPQKPVRQAAASQAAAPQPVVQPARAAEPPFAAPMPTQKPKRSPKKETQVASTGSGYVVQVAARKSQTDALAAFAELEQKYTKLLSGYRPMIQRADLSSGTWYRLRVGPMQQKTAASTLCKKLKSAGLRSCLVRKQ